MLRLLIGPNLKGTVVVSDLAQDRLWPQRLNLPWCHLSEDRAMLLNLDSGEYSELGGAAPFIWICLNGTSTFEGVVQRMTSRFAIDHDRAKKDLER